MVGFKRCDDAAVLPKGLALEDAEVVAGIVDARGHENRGAPVIVEAWLGIEIVDDAGSDAHLAILSTHQFLHRRPAFTDDGFLEVVQRFGFLSEIIFNRFWRGQSLWHITSLVFQIQHHFVRYSLMELVGMDVSAEDILCPEFCCIFLE